MKRLLVVALLLAGGISLACAGGDQPIQVAQMPDNARNFIKKHFGDIQVSFARKETMPVSYEVVFVNGSKVEFDSHGEWTEVDCEHGVVPDEIVPRQIVRFVDENHPGRKIVGISRERHGYDVTLSNGLDLKFDADYRLVGIDD